MKTQLLLLENLHQDLARGAAVLRLQELRPAPVVGPVVGRAPEARVGAPGPRDEVLAHGLRPGDPPGRNE